MTPITLVIAHHEKAIRTFCIRLLQPEKGIGVVGQARSGVEVIAAVARLKPHILLLELNLSRGKGIVLLRALRQKSPRTKVILFTRRAPESRTLEALSYGAMGYLEEKVISTFLPKAVRVVHGGEAWIPRKMVARIIDRLAQLIAQEQRSTELLY